MEEEFRRGWPVVAVSLVGIGLGLAAIPFYTLGLFAPHLARAFGWSMGAIMGGLSVMTLASIAGAPIVGLLCNRIGARPVAIGSLLLFGLGLAVLGLSTGSLALYYATWGALSLLGAGTLPITWTRAINGAFDRRRGLALGLALMGTGLFGFFGKPLTAALIAALGWRGAFAGLGLLPILIAAPVALALFREPGSSPARGGGPPPQAVVEGVPLRTGRPAAGVLHQPAAGPPSRAGEELGVTLGQAAREWRLWLLGAALVPVSFALAGPIPNMEAILRGDGLPPAAIAATTPFIGLAALAGRAGGGWLLDRVWAPGAGFVILCLPAIGLGLLAHGGITPPAALLAVVLIGFAIGVEYDLVAFLVARYFGMRSYAPVYGLLYIAFLTGAGFAPMLFGRAFDRVGSYAPVLHAALVGLLLGAAALLALGRYRFRAGAQADSV